MPRSPPLLVDNLHHIRYKYCYVYMVMQLDADEMCVTHLFTHSTEHIRTRHLFLQRAGFYDPPNRKTGATKFANPRLGHIVDLPLEAYLHQCARGLFTPSDFHTFKDYLSGENFGDELLGHKMVRDLRTAILHDYRVELRESIEAEKAHDDDEYSEEAAREGDSQTSDETNVK